MGGATAAMTWPGQPTEAAPPWTAGALGPYGETIQRCPSPGHDPPSRVRMDNQGGPPQVSTTASADIQDRPSVRQPWDDPSGRDPAMVLLRIGAVERLLQMSNGHSFHAWQQRHHRRICPHALAFLYTDRQNIGGGVWSVIAATRMEDDLPDLRDPRRLVQRLTTVAQEWAATPAGLRVAAQLADQHDPPRGMVSFLGVGLCTLDTRHGTWEQSEAAAAGYQDVPGRAFALLRDGTALAVDREPGFADNVIRSSANLSHPTGLSAWRWTGFDHDPAPPHLWTLLQQLGRIVVAAEPEPAL